MKAEASHILLPGPAIGSHTTTVSAPTNDHRGRVARKSAKFPGDGRGVVQIEEYLNAHYADWHKFLGCEIRVDWCGKGASAYVLEESWGVLTLTQPEVKS